jgi:hypothetical protein
MTAEQTRALGPAFAAYLRPFEACFVSMVSLLLASREGYARRTGWPWAVAGPGLPQTRTCSH